MKKLKILILLIGFVAAAFVAIGYSLPASWEVSRSIEIQAPPEKIYPLIADFKNGWSKWSAFDFADPTIQYTYSGPEMGERARREWISESMGDGAQEIIIADPKTGIEFNLDMRNSFKIKGQISLDPIPVGTRVVFKDYGETGMNVLHRYYGYMMESMMGKTFEMSLAKLKETAESSGP
jgi:hypothetical protein